MLPIVLALIFNEVMNNPSDGSCGEFIELYNDGSDTVSLAGTGIADGEDFDLIMTLSDPPPGLASTYSIPPGHFALIMDPDYFDGCGDQYPLTGNVLIVDDASIGNGLSLSDSLYLISTTGDTIARFERPIPSVPSSHSLERINYMADAWGISRIAGGTPGRVNSIFSPSPIIVDSLYMEDSALIIVLKNLADSTIETQATVMAAETLTIPLTLPPMDTTIIFLQNEVLTFRMELVVDSLRESFYVPSGYPLLVINEIEYDENPEWLELYNGSGDTIDLSRFYIEDMAGNVLWLHGTLLPDTFAVFSAGDYPDFPSLNDTYESLTLKSRWGLLFDTLYYSSSYGGEGPFTLEKINPALPGHERSSWTGSLMEGGTPGRKNSVFLDAGKLEGEVYLEPRYPEKGQEVILTYNVPVLASSVKIYLFDDMGRRLMEMEGPEGRGIVRFRAPDRRGIYIILIKADGWRKKEWIRVI